MSLPPIVGVLVRGRFPRVSGDEPLADAGLLRALEFSPRERG